MGRLSENGAKAPSQPQTDATPTGTSAEETLLCAGVCVHTAECFSQEPGSQLQPPAAELPMATQLLSSNDSNDWFA